jgi:hypothetical protein
VLVSVPHGAVDVAADAVTVVNPHAGGSEAQFLPAMPDDPFAIPQRIAVQSAGGIQGLFSFPVFFVRFDVC